MRAVAPLGAIGAVRSSDEDLGVPVKMFENPNLDRYLRRAESFLGDANYVAAIEVLQDVIQGRTVEFLGSSDEFAPPPANADKTSGKTGNDPAAKDAPKKKAPKAKAPKGPSSVELDAANSVFSRDGRLYRPVRRLCHELLAEMPAAGIELYRTLHEVAARQMFEAAMASGSISELEKVINRYFITLPAGRAMVVLADRFMHEGRYRAAVQVLRDLIEIYPAANLKRVGADPIWCKFKIALCLRMAGESGVAQEAVREIAKEHPEDSLRILGELQSVRELPELPIFADEVIALLEGALADSGPSWLTDGVGADPEAANPDGAGPEELVPLWQYRFADPRPYRSPKSKRDRNRGFIRWGNSQRTTAMPHADRYGPASWIRFVPGESAGKPPRALFFDHYRLRVADARTGLMLQAGDGLDVPSKPRQGYPRIRIAAVDHALMRPVEDEVRRYAVLGHQKTPTQNVSTLRTSKLVAYDRVTMAPLWDSTQWLDGEDGLRDVTFLARPTVFGERLLLPAMRRDAYSLECLDRSTGRPLWHTMLHSGGSPFFKAPGSPVVVNGGIAFALTNAGCLAAVDAFAGDLRWIRRYEREDPLRPKMRPKGSGGSRNVGSRFVQSELSGFLPNDLIVKNGLVIFAGCDSGVVACVDSASGQPVWLVDGTTRYAPYGTLKTIVGATASDVFLTSDTALVCIGLRGGLVKWMQELPAISGRKNVGRGRGTIAGDRVLIPGEGEIFVFDVKNAKAMERLRLPSFGVGREPLQLPFNIQSAGSWLGIGYRGGVEVFSSRSALRGLAQEATDDPWRAAGLRISAGDLQEAEKILFEWLADPSLDDRTKQKGCRRLLALVRERAMNLAEQKQLAQAMAAFDAIAGLCEERSVRLGWHLARVEVSKAAGDLRAHESEQQRLYDFMEGKG